MTSDRITATPAFGAKPIAGRRQSRLHTADQSCYSSEIKSAAIALGLHYGLPVSSGSLPPSGRKRKLKRGRVLKVESTSIPDVKVITPATYDDGRGSFSELYNRRVFAKHGIDVVFVQDNCSFSQRKGTIRGLHFQLPPYAQHKLVRVSCGSIFDVAVDLRFGSSTYGQHVTVALSRSEGNQLLVPVGFAHGFCTLEDETEVVYKVSEFYEPAYDSGVFWADPDLGIAWPVAPDDAILSAKDRALPAFNRSSPVFHGSAHGSDGSNARRGSDDAA